MINKKDEITIDDYMSTKYIDFSMYVIESRAISSVVDGLKISQRKVLACSYDTWKNDKGDMKAMKVFQLSGKVCQEMFFHHGDSSMNSTIITMAQKFKNNLPILEGVGQIGTRFSPESGAPRYVGAKLNVEMKKVLKDFELLEYRYEEGNRIEPKYFLPIIPMVLCNGASGISVGFAANILNRGVKDVIKECISYLKTGKAKNITPSYTYFSGDFIADKENHLKWYSRGIYEILNTNTIKITELPLSYTYEKYEAILDKLVEQGKILEYEDNSSANIEYVVKIKRDILASLTTDDDVISYLKLEESFTENITLLDEFGKLKLFNTIEEVLKYFVDFRLTYYYKRKTYLITKIEKELSIMDNKMRFVKSIIDGNLVVNNRKKEVIVKDLSKMKFDTQENSFDYLLRMPIYSLTKETYDKIKEDIKEKKNELAIVKKSNPKDTYIDELEVLKNSLK